MTKILIKRLSNNIPLPKYETEGSSGMDLTANVDKVIEIQPGKSEIIPTGLSLSIPKNYEIQIRPRSGLAAVRAKMKIDKIFRAIKVRKLTKKIVKNNIRKILKGYEIICDGTDNFDTRYLINDECKKNKKILISAAINKFDGQIFKFNFKKKGPCLRCFMPERPEQENNCGSEGIFSPVAGILGSLQANEVLKTILNLKDDLNNNILLFNALKSSLRKIKINSNPSCHNKCQK